MVVSKVVLGLYGRLCVAVGRVAWRVVWMVVCGCRESCLKDCM